MMEKAFAAAHLDWRYLTLEVSPDNLEAAVAGMRAMGFRGANFASPHQVDVIPYLDSLSEAAEWLNAVNCVYVENDRYVGENTEGKGFVEALRNIHDPADKKAVVLGADGTGSAIAVELCLAGVGEVLVADRNADRGQTLVNLLREKLDVSAELVTWQEPLVMDDDTQLVINATTIGHRDASAEVLVDFDSLSDRLVVADVIHNPPLTRFLQDAAGRGCAVLDGLAMLVHQAAHDFKIWTGLEPDKSVMRESVEEYFEL
jgi:shikimate dehydrogenase